RWVLLWLRHHLTGDRTTLDVLQREVRAYMRGEQTELPAPLPFRNFVAQARLGVAREEHETFFTRMLADVDEPTAPFGLREVRGEGAQIAMIRRRVDDELTRRLRVCVRGLGVSVASACHIAFARLLACLSGRDDVVFGTVLFGRMRGGEGADWVPGLF